MRIVSKVRTALTRYKADKSGQFAVMFSLFAIPLMMAVGIVVDLNVAQKNKTQLAAALDATALAAVTKQNVTEAERINYAETYFAGAFEGAADYDFKVVSAKGDTVEVAATGFSPVTFARAMGRKGLKIREKSTAVLTRTKVVCILALNPNGMRTFSVTNRSTFESPTCAVQVNSNHSRALQVDKTSSAIAADFCVVGGVEGTVSPYANTECSKLDDPYKSVRAPASTPCISLGIKKKDLAAMTTELTMETGTSAEVVDGVTLYPGTYCGDINISAANVKFAPGIYIFDDARVRFRAGSSVVANEVTFVVKGARSTINVEKDSKFVLTAPRTGPFAGLAIFQDSEDEFPGNKRVRSRIKGGATMEITGTIYLPGQEIEVFGSSEYGNITPATAYIGYEVHIKNNSTLSVRVDHTAAGLPPVLPRADEGARIAQ
ncbi:MAG: hypothetical protein HKN36_11560 [Hellea sp.]|nr:hypothetical protein [Hellea sp.]